MASFKAPKQRIKAQTGKWSVDEPPAVWDTALG